MTPGLQGSALAGACAEICATHLSRECSVTLFGSLARGEGDDRSDLDLLLVGDEDWGSGELLSVLEDEIRERTGWSVEALTYSPSEAVRALGASTGVLPIAALEGVHVWGARLAALVNHEITFDVDADRQAREARMQGRTAEWQSSLAALRARGEVHASVERTCLWETGRHAAEVILARLDARRMGGRRVPEAIEALHAHGYEDAARALEVLWEAELRDDLWGEELDAALPGIREAAEVLVACAG